MGKEGFSSRPETMKSKRVSKKSNETVDSTKAPLYGAYPQLDPMEDMQIYFPTQHAPCSSSAFDIRSSPAFNPCLLEDQQPKQHFRSLFPYSTSQHHGNFYEYPSMSRGVVLTSPGKEKVVPEEKDLLLKECKDISESAAIFSNRTVKNNNVTLAYGNDAQVAGQRTVSKIEGPSNRRNLLGDSADRMIGVTQNFTKCQKFVNEKAALSKDEELKKERRKQSNRESAKRSRLRKRQMSARTECETLEAKAEELRYSISKLSSKLERYSEKSVQLIEENALILEDLKRLHGPAAVADLIEMHEKLLNGDSTNQGGKSSS